MFDVDKEFKKELKKVKDSIIDLRDFIQRERYETKNIEFAIVDSMIEDLRIITNKHHWISSTGECGIPQSEIKNYWKPTEEEEDD